MVKEVNEASALGDQTNEKDMSANYLTPKADERVGALLDAPPNEEILEAESKFTID